MHHVKQADSRLEVRPMPVDARDMRHYFGGSKKKRAVGGVCAKTPAVLRHLRSLFPIHQSSTDPAEWI